MLKYFGLKEILFGLKRFAIIILAATLICGVAGYVIGDKNESMSGVVETYYSSCSYLVVAELNDTAQSQSESDIAVANIISTMITADFSKQYVFEKLLETYSVEEIIKNIGASVPKDNADYSMLNDCIVSRVLAGTSVVNFYVKSPSKEFSMTAVACFESYLTEVADGQVSRLDSLQYLGGTTTTERGFNNESVSSAKRSAVVYAIIGFVLAVCGVLLYVLFKPTIATKADFEDYGVEVLDDTAEHKNDNYSYAADMISKQINAGGCRVLSVVSSMKTKSIAAKKESIIEKLRDVSGEKCDFLKADAISDDFTQFETVKKSDGVVLVERKGRTVHADFRNTLSLLAKYEIPVIGVVLI